MCSLLIFCSSGSLFKLFLSGLLSSLHHVGSPLAGAKPAMLSRRLTSMLAGDSSQDAAATIVTTEVTAEGSEQQYEWLHYIPFHNLDRPGRGRRWQGRTVHGTMHEVYRRAFKEKHVKLAIEASNKCMFDWEIIPPGNASKRSKPADSYIIPCSSTTI